MGKPQKQKKESDWLLSYKKDITSQFGEDLTEQNIKK